MGQRENDSKNNDDELSGIYKGYLSAFDKINAPFKIIPGFRKRIEEKRRILKERLAKKDERFKKFKSVISVLKGNNMAEKLRCSCGEFITLPSNSKAGEIYNCPKCKTFMIKCPKCGNWAGTDDREILDDPSSFYCLTCESNFSGESNGGDTKYGEHKHSSKEKASALYRYGRCLITLARNEKIEPVIGREQEINKVIEILIRKGKNNPILTGEAGVGKTAVVEGLALAIASKNVPKVLLNSKIIQIDMGNLVSGTKYRGMFEERLTGIIKEASANPEVILFIDEIHTIMGAGDSEGATDAANILKPALARGELRCIGATTNDEYEKYIEKDPALERRFQPVRIEEISPDATKKLLLKLKSGNENYYKVTIVNASIESAVDLSVKYILNRRLPDKAIDVLHQACAKAIMRNIKEVNEKIVREVVSEWTGIPLLEAGEEECHRILRMEQILKENIFGQDKAIEKVSEAIKKLRAGLKDPMRPAGVFLFLGSTGVGKTELAKVLAAFLFGSKDRIIRVDMSEFMEEHSISKLIGSPPGYAGHDESISFIDNLRRRPYSIVLLDEIEKAHHRIFDLFLQVFDEGRLTDSKGRTIDVKNCMFIMTSNLKKEGLEDKFKPEFLNRLDEIVIFNPLAKDSVLKIANHIVEEIKQERLNKKDISLELDEGILEFLYQKDFNPEMGARSLKRTIERLIVVPLSEEILSGRIKEGQKIRAKIVNDKVELVNLGAKTEPKSIKEKAREPESTKPLLKEEKSTEEAISIKTAKSGRCPNQNCKSIVSKTAKFCRECGTKLGGDYNG